MAHVVAPATESIMTLNPVAVNYQCWAARRASAHIGADGTTDFDREA